MKKIFTISALALASLTASAEVGDQILTLDQLDATKTYNLETVRGLLISGEDGLIIDKLENLTDEEKAEKKASPEARFAFIQKDGEYYFYSVSAENFVTKLNKFGAPAAITVTDTYAEDDSQAENARRWFLSWGEGYNMNNNGNAIVIDGWTAPDDGNRNSITEAPKGATDKAFPSLSLYTYNLIYNDEIIKTVEAFGARNFAPWLPEEFVVSSCDFVGDVELIGRSTKEINYTATWQNYFEFSADVESAKWYNLDIRREKATPEDYYWVYYESDAKAMAPRETASGWPNYENIDRAAYKWTILGNPWAAQLYNKKANKYYANVDGNPGFTDEPYDWKIDASANGGFSLYDETQTVNQNGQEFGFWGGRHTDDGGSSIQATLNESDDTPTTEITFNAVYNGEVVKTVTAEALVGDPIAVPADINNGLVDYEDPEGTVEDGATYDITVTANENINFVLDGSKWYNVDLRDSKWVNTILVDEEHYNNIDKGNVTEADLETPAYLWSFVGNPYQVKILNAAFPGQALTHVGDFAVMQEGEYIWNIYQNGDGFGLEATDDSGLYINDNGGRLGYWKDPAAKYDGGGKFHAIEAISGGIDGVNADSKGKKGAIYNLQGQQVKSALKGIYIINGVKYVK